MNRERLRELLDYNPSTGVFLWKKPTSSKIKVGDVAGCSVGSGYVGIGLDGRRYYAHRLVWLYVNGRWPKADIDHIDANKANNRLDNLREATRSQNNFYRQASSRNRSGYVGVWFDRARGKWAADVIKGRKHHFVGRFDTAEEAARARKSLAEQHYGDFVFSQGAQ